MKTKLLRTSALVVLATASAHAITLDLSTSRWDSSGMFIQGNDGENDYFMTAGSPAETAAYGGWKSDAYFDSFGFANFSRGTELGSTTLAQNTALNLSFTFSEEERSNLNAIYMVGGSMDGATWVNNGNNTHTLHLATKTTRTVTSGVKAGETSNFGISFDTRSGYDFHGALFQTDISPEAIEVVYDYNGTEPIGMSINGQNGTEATLRGYIPFSLMGEAGISDPSMFNAVVQKAGETLSIDYTGEIYCEESLWDDWAEQDKTNNCAYVTESMIDFTGDSSFDSFAIVEMSNDQWSTGNMGLAIPEPATITFVLFSGISLLGIRRIFKI